MKDDKEIISAIKHMFDNKMELIASLQGLGIKVPAKSSYSQILNIIRESDLEEKFAQAVFHTSNLKSGVRMQDVIQGLSTLSLSELKSLAQELSRGETIWKYRKTPKVAVVDAITRNSSPDDMNTGIQKLVRSGEIEPYQMRKWIIGSLGMTKSVEERDTFGSPSVLDFLKTYFDEQICADFIHASRVPIKLRKLQATLTKDDVYQLILTHCTTRDIIETTNSLIIRGKLKILSVEDYYDFYASPAGLFRAEYADPLIVFTDILLKQFDDAELRRDFELPQGELKQCLMQKLLLDKPDRVLDDFFGISQLKRIAKSFGLVAVDAINDKQKLIELLMIECQ